MPNLADETLDLFVKHDIDLMRVDADLRKKIDGMLAGLNDKVKRRLTNFEYVNSNPVVQNKKLNQLVYVAASDSNKAFEQITNVVNADLKDLAVLQGATVTDTLNKAVRVDLASNQVHLAKLKALAGNTMIEGAPIKEWWSRQSPNFIEQFKDQIRAGMLNQETMPEMIRRVQGSRDSGYQDGIIAKAGKRAHRLVRTSVLAVANEARMETYKANSDVIKGVQWVSTLDNRTSDICIALDGQAWTLDGRRMKGTTQNWQGPPPAHWNCRSTTIPITKTFSELARDSKNKKKFAGLDKATKNKFRASANGKQAANLNYEGWLRKQPVSEQKAVLGETKFRLWKANKISFTDLVDQKQNPLSVAQLISKFDSDRFIPPSKVLMFQPPIEGVVSKKPIFEQHWTPYERKFLKQLINESDDTPAMLVKMHTAGIESVNYKHITWNKELADKVSEIIIKDGKKFTNPVVKDVLYDLRIGINGHEFIRYKRGIIDVMLTKKGVPQATINKFDKYLEDVYRRAGSPDVPDIDLIKTISKTSILKPGDLKFDQSSVNLVGKLADTPDLNRYQAIGSAVTRNLVKIPKDLNDKVIDVGEQVRKTLASINAINAKRNEDALLIWNSTGRQAKTLPGLDDIFQLSNSNVDVYRDLRTKIKPYMQELRTKLLTPINVKAREVEFESWFKKTLKKPLSWKKKNITYKLDGDTVSSTKWDKLHDELKEIYLMTGIKPSTLKKIKGLSTRGYASRLSGELDVGLHRKSTVFHEYGHHIEFDSDIRRASAFQFLNQRRTSDKTYKLSSQQIGSGYRADERSYLGDYFEPYQSKDYSWIRNGIKIPSTSTEVISMGFEQFASASDMAELYIRDNRLFNYILGIIKDAEI